MELYENLMGFSIPAETAKAIKFAAATKRISQSEVARAAFRAWLDAGDWPPDDMKQIDPGANHMINWIPEATKPTPLKAVLLCTADFKIIPGHWASELGHWLGDGYSLNRPPPYYRIENVTHWAEINYPDAPDIHT